VTKVIGSFFSRYYLLHAALYVGACGDNGILNIRAESPVYAWSVSWGPPSRATVRRFDGLFEFSIEAFHTNLFDQVVKRLGAHDCKYG
jgi:hypothetical protein